MAYYNIIGKMIIILIFAGISFRPLYGSSSQLNYSLYMGGDLVIGGLFPIFDPAPEYSDKCSDRFAVGQALVVYSIVYSAHKINTYSHILKNIKIGLDIKPTCSDPVIALIESIKFIDPGPGPRQGYNLSSFEFGKFFEENQDNLFRAIRYGGELIQSAFDLPPANSFNASYPVEGISSSGISSRRKKRSPCQKGAKTAVGVCQLGQEQLLESQLLPGYGSDDYYIFSDVAAHENKMRYIRDIFDRYKRNKLRESESETNNLPVVSGDLSLNGEGGGPHGIHGIVKRQITSAGSLENSQPNLVNGNARTPTTRFPNPTIKNTYQTAGATINRVTPLSPNGIAATTTTATLLEPIEIDSRFFQPNQPSETMSEQERITLQATLNFMNKEPDIKALIEGLGNSAKIVSPLLSSYQIPQVSYKNSDDNLANKMFYPFLLRFAVSNRVYVDAILGLLQHYGWTYVNILYQDNDNSENLYEMMKAELTKANMCTFVETRLEAVDTNLGAKMKNFTSAILESQINVSMANSAVGGGIGARARGATTTSFGPNVTGPVYREEVSAKVVLTFLTRDKIIKMLQYLDTMSGPGQEFVAKDIIFIGVYTWPKPIELEFAGLHGRMGQISCLYFNEVSGKISDYLVWFRTIGLNVYAREPLMGSYKQWIEDMYRNGSDIILRHVGNLTTTLKVDESTLLSAEMNESLKGPITALQRQPIGNSSSAVLSTPQPTSRHVPLNRDKFEAFLWSMEEEVWGLEIFKILEAMELLAKVLDKLKWKYCRNATTAQELNECILGEDIFNEMKTAISIRRFFKLDL